MQQGSNTSEAEIRLMGLILAQSALVGLAIGLFDADMWLNTNDPLVNGFTYAMAAFSYRELRITSSKCSLNKTCKSV